MAAVLPVGWYRYQPVVDVLSAAGRDFPRGRISEITGTRSSGRTSVLHALSGSRAYHHVYAGSYTPWQITDFLVLNLLFPRSVAYCYAQLQFRLNRLAGWHGHSAPCLETIATMTADLESMDSGEIFRRGLHETVQNGLRNTNKLGAEIAEAYHFG